MTIQFKAYDVREERISVPAPNQFRVEHNPNYVDSLIAGCLSPIIHLPQILWFGSFWPFLKSLWKGLSFIVYSIMAGLAGQANGFQTVEVKERTLSDEEKQAALDDMLQGTGFVAVKLSDLGASQADRTGRI